jgi:hypothetical protein
MNIENKSSTTILIIALLVANLGISAYTAFRPSLRSGTSPAERIATSEITKAQAEKIADTVIPVYNTKDSSALFDLFDPLAQIQFTKEDLATQIEKLSVLMGQIDSSAYSHATIAGNNDGRTYYTLHYKVRLTGGQIPTGEMTLNVVKNGTGLILYGFFIKGNTGTSIK